MNSLSIQFPRHARGRCCLLFLVLALLVLPYLIDVAYYGDFTPTHFAQENLINEDADPIEDKELLVISTHEGDADLVKFGFAAAPLLWILERFSVRDVSSPQHLSSVSVISRPPPDS